MTLFRIGWLAVFTLAACLSDPGPAAEPRQCTDIEGAPFPGVSHNHLDWRPPCQLTFPCPG